MAYCVRGGTTYKRHQFKNGRCKICLEEQKPKNKKG